MHSGATTSRSIKSFCDFINDIKYGPIKGYVEDSGEGRWTLQQAIDTDVPAPVTALSLFARFRSRQDNTFTERVLAALRREFGGHSVKTGKEQTENFMNLGR